MSTNLMPRVSGVVLCVIVLVSIIARADESVINPESEAIARKLETCPLWSDAPANDIDRRVKITEIYVDIAKYDTAIIREGIVLYLQRYTNPPSYQFYFATDKVSALLRVVFKVPTGPTPTNRQLPGNYNAVNPLWPFSIGDDGRLQLMGVMGFRSGPGSDSLADFDKTALRFERRFPARK